jgi:orotidine-5'-phosphate decarboxylase
MNFFDKLSLTTEQNNSLLCIGLDPDMSKIPTHIGNTDEPLFNFNQEIIDKTHDLVCAYKPNIAYYAAEGIKGLAELKKTIDYIHATYPEIPVILDAKRGDIDSTAAMYAREVFGFFNADAVTVNPYLGFDSIKPFLTHSEKGIIILCKTSNPSSSELQDIRVDHQPLYMHIAQQVKSWDSKFQNCLLVVGATFPQELKQVRDLLPDMIFLVPGVGSQGGNLDETLANGLRVDKAGLIINVGRAIIFASPDDYAQKARVKAQEIREQINSHRYR